MEEEGEEDAEGAEAMAEAVAEEEEGGGAVQSLHQSGRRKIKGELGSTRGTEGKENQGKIERGVTNHHSRIYSLCDGGRSTCHDSGDPSSHITNLTNHSLGEDSTT